MRALIILAALFAATPAFATGGGGPGGGGGGDGGASGAGGSGGMSSACPFPTGPTPKGTVSGNDFCLMNQSIPVLVKQTDPSWQDQGLVPVFWKGTKGDILSVE